MATRYGKTSADIISGTRASDTLYSWAEGGNANSPSGNDQLFGKEGDDKLYGGTGDDTLFGEVGNDTLDGGLGKDTMLGGAGDDLYIIDNPKDRVIESFNQGIDTVSISSPLDDEPSINYTLGQNIENLEGGAFIELYATGNALNNRLIGGYISTNYLYGRDGNDYIEAGGKSNNYLYGEAGDDTLISPFTNTLLIQMMDGGEGNDTLTGSLNGYGDTLVGGAGNDKITGLYGSDILTGGKGNDQFIYTNPNEGSGTDLSTDKPAIERISDFSIANDTIVVSAVGFGGELTPNAAITPERFALGGAATDASDRFIYDSSSGALWFDVDGTGSTAAVQLVYLSAGLAMTNNDIFVSA